MDTKEIDRNIKELFLEWKSLQPLEEKNQETFNKKVRLDWNYHSNKIEGNTLTYGETQLLLMFDRYEGGHIARDYMEMKAHDVAVKKVCEMAEEQGRPLTQTDIRDLNKIILKEPFFKKAETLDGKETQKRIEPGQYKKTPNHVKTPSGELFKFSEPEEVPVKMSELTDYINNEITSPSNSITLFLAKLHHEFLLIHPFDDGNGRVGRLLLNYVLLKLGYPPMVIKNNDREHYLIALAKADTGDIATLELYLGKVLISWLKIGIKAAKGEDISEPDDTDKEVEIFIRSKSKTLTLDDIDRKKVLCDGLFVPLATALEVKLDPFKKLFSSYDVSINSMSTKEFNETAKFFHTITLDSFRSLLSKSRVLSIDIWFFKYKYIEKRLRY